MEPCSWVYTLSPQRLREELDRRELVSTGTVPTMRARLLRYEQYRARSEELPPTPESFIEDDTNRLAVPPGETEYARPDSPSNLEFVMPIPSLVPPEEDAPARPSSLSGPRHGEASGHRGVVAIPRRVIDRSVGRDPGSLYGPGEPTAEGARAMPSTPRYQLPHNDTAWSARSQSNATHIYNIMRKWNLQFSGARGSDAEAFLERIEEGRMLTTVSDGDVFRCLPFFLSGTALYWYRAKRNNWRSWDDFVAAWRTRFGDPDFTFALKDEIMRRTQSEHEPVAEYITCMLTLFDRLSPPWPLYEQLNHVYHNMLPRLQISVKRDDFYDFESLERLAIRVERSYEVAKRYQAPPALERSLFSDLAYRPPRKGRASENLTAVAMPENKNWADKTKKSNSTAPAKENKKGTSSKINATKDRPDVKCWNCGKQGHLSRNCSEAKKVHCYRCGKPEVTVKTCPKCTGNTEGSE